MSTLVSNEQKLRKRRGTNSEFDDPNQYNNVRYFSKSSDRSDVSFGSEEVKNSSQGRLSKLE